MPIRSQLLSYIINSVTFCWEISSNFYYELATYFGFFGEEGKLTRLLLSFLGLKENVFFGVEGFFFFLVLLNK